MQSQNSCGTIASIYPPNVDSVVALGTIVDLTSTSINANQYEWLINGLNFGVSAPNFQFIVEAGVFKFSLVAINGTCRDTTSVVYFCAGTPSNTDTIKVTSYGSHRYAEEPTFIGNTLDSSLLIGGIRYLWGYPCYGGSSGIIAKINKRGCLDWSKEIVTPYTCNSTDINNAFESIDSSIYVSTVNTNIAKLDKLGNLLWNKALRNSPNYLVPNENLHSDSLGNLLIVVEIEEGFSICKLNAQGNLLWNKTYKYPFNPISNMNYSEFNVFSTCIIDSNLYISGGMNILNNTTEPPTFLLSFNTNTGIKNWQYAYKNPNFSNAAEGTFIHLSSYGKSILASSRTQGHGVTIISSQGQVLKSIRSKFQNSYTPDVTKAYATSDGRIYQLQRQTQTLILQPGYFYYNNITVVDTTLRKYWGNSLGKYERPRYDNMVITKKNKFVMIGNDNSKVDDGIFSSRDLRVFELDTAFKKDIDCEFSTYDNDFSVFNESYVKSPMDFRIDTTLNYEVVDGYPYSTIDGNIKARQNCPDFLDSCSFMSISGPSIICNFNQTYKYTIHRNRKCALQPQWILPPNATIVYQTDTTIGLRFTAANRFVLNAKLSSCFPINDSIVISSRLQANSINLGIDTSICTGTTITLQIPNTFLNIQWSTGATTNSININQPGQYWVKATDSCSNLITDTILINPFNSQLYIGPDRVKCNNDTIHINAPSGFLNYTWSNNYNISSLTAQNVIVNPLVDTSYYLKAEKVQGCFAFDTVKIKVNTSPIINLGLDKRICIGDSILLNAGNNFTSYQWNTGQNVNAIYVKDIGTFTVKATFNNGCISTDTIKIISLYNKPVLNLNKNSNLCVGENRILSPGVFSSYLWQNNSTSPTFTVTTIGTYFVQVTDNRNCKNADTVVIKNILPTPNNFVTQKDTSICLYDKLVLKTNSTYNSYLWSTGSTSNSITIIKPNIYWLKVVDVNKCIGIDTITITDKKCIQGVFFPTAFMPNGFNKLYKPIIYENLSKYSFSIYDRYGKLVFYSNTIGDGWDGKINGVQQNTGTYVYICIYQPDRKKEEVEKGSFLLIR